MQAMGASGVLVGREAQVEALHEFLQGAPAGRPPVMLVAGEAGVGKTALVDHALAGAGQPVRRGWAAGRKTAVYEVLAQVLTPAATSQPMAPAGLWSERALVPALAGAISGGPVVLIGCYRSDELPRDHRLRAARAELRRARQLAEIDLAPLPDACVPIN